MPRINLLPWREELHKRRQKDFFVMLGAAAAAMAGVVFLVHLHFSNAIEFQQTRNQYLKDQIAQLDKKIKQIKDLDQEKERLLARMEIIQQLQSSRPEVVHLFDELVETLPDGVYLKKVSQKGRGLSLQGVAQSNARVSSLMRNLDGSDWLSKPALVEIKADNRNDKDPVRLSDFSMRVQQSKPVAANEEGS